jgi:hypothetical protein
MMISGFSMTFMLSAPLGNPMMNAFSFFDPKNARRIFYVHINRLLVHIGAFDPVHIAIIGADSSAVDAAGRGVRSQRRIAVGGMLWIGQARIVIDTLLSLAQIGEADA